MNRCAKNLGTHKKKQQRVTIFFHEMTAEVSANVKFKWFIKAIAFKIGQLNPRRIGECLGTLSFLVFEITMNKCVWLFSSLLSTIAKMTDRPTLSLLKKWL